MCWSVGTCHSWNTDQLSFNHVVSTKITETSFRLILKINKEKGTFPKLQSQKFIYMMATKKLKCILYPEHFQIHELHISHWNIQETFLKFTRNFPPLGKPTNKRWSLQQRGFYWVSSYRASTQDTSNTTFGNQLKDAFSLQVSDLFLAFISTVLEWRCHKIV